MRELVQGAPGAFALAFDTGLIKKYTGIGVATSENLEKEDRCEGNGHKISIYICTFQSRLC